MPTTMPLLEPKTSPRTESEERQAPLYQVILFDDDEHSYAYVVEMMMNLFAMTAEEGFNIAYEVDFVGQSLVKTCPYEEAVEAHRKIVSYGPDFRLPNSRSSMGCRIEKVEG